MTENDTGNKELFLKIDSLAYGPYGVGRERERVIFVPLTAPGDELEVRIVEERKNYSVGEISRLVKPSPLRQPPPCPYFGECGGCQWQQVRYETQLAAKEKNLQDALHRIGKLTGYELLPILRSPQEHHYRRRLRLHVDENKSVGFYRSSSHSIIEVDTCLIADPEVDRHLSEVRGLIRDLRTHIEQIELVKDDESGLVVLTGKAAGGFFPDDNSICNSFLEQQKEIGGLVIFGNGWRKIWGKGTIFTRSDDELKLEMDVEVFSQVNREGNSRLVRELLQWGEFKKQDRVLELYCGAGNFTLPMARRSRKVVAIEGDPLSVKCNKKNSRTNQIENIHWIRSHVPEAVKQLELKGEKFSKIVLNPPRSGAKGLEENLTSLGAEKILYISCNPPTLARDLAALSKKGYRLTRIQPIDLFPQTYHVEALAEMVR